MIEGRIIKGIGGFYYIETEKGLYECRARGIFRKNKITPLVGDFVKISVVDEDNKKGVVEEIAERETELVRPPIANVDKALIVFAVKNPTPHLSLLDRFIVLAERENLEIVIILTKIDLDDDNTFEKIKNIYEPCGYKVIGVSNLENKNIDKVKEELKDNTVVFAGPSGVGKSSLLNQIDSNFQLKTGDVSDKIKRGKHTTRHVELFEINDIYFIDTPGFSALDIHVPKENIKFAFKEFKNDECKFRDCKHINEIGCKVLEDVENKVILESRYENYKKMVME